MVAISRRSPSISLLLVALELGDVGADRDEAAVLGAPLVDLQPAAVLELQLEAARAFLGPPVGDDLRARTSGFRPAAITSA